MCGVCICKHFGMLSFPTLFFVAALSVRLEPTDWLGSLVRELWHLCLFLDSAHTPAFHPFLTLVLGLPASIAVSGFGISVENLNSDHHPCTRTLPTNPSSQPLHDAFDFKASHHFFPEAFASSCKPSTMADPEKRRKLESSETNEG